MGNVVRQEPLLCQVVPAHLVKCCIQYREDWNFRWILLCPHEDVQEQRLSSASIAFLCLRQVHDHSAGTPSALDKTQSTLRSSFDYGFLFLLASSFLDSPRLEQRHSINKWRRQAFACRLFQHEEFFSEGKKNLVNSANNENSSNYQLLKHKPSLWSISLHLSIFLTIVQLYFAWRQFLQWFQLLYYYMRNFCNLIGLEQWYFSLIWNTYMRKLQTFCE